MSLRLVSENPLKYVDGNGKDVPVRSLLDIETGKKAFVVFDGDFLTIVHVPRELTKKKAWRQVLDLDVDSDILSGKKCLAAEKTRIKNITKAEVKAIER